MKKHYVRNWLENLLAVVNITALTIMLLFIFFYNPSVDQLNALGINLFLGAFMITSITAALLKNYGKHWSKMF